MNIQETVNETAAKPVDTLAHYFQPYLEIPPQSLSRMRGDWKKTLTAQVIKHIRRKGLVEELFLSRGRFQILLRLIFATKEN